MILVSETLREPERTLKQDQDLSIPYKGLSVSTLSFYLDKIKNLVEILIR